MVLGYLLYPYRIVISEEVHGSDLMICRGYLSDCSKPLIRVPTSPNRQDRDQEPKHYGNQVVDLPFDLISACSEKFEAVMNPDIALSYKLATSLPFQYNIVPSTIRRFLLRRMREIDANLSQHLGNEMARRILVQAFDLAGFKLRRKNPPSVLITHDIDSEKGLRRARSLKFVEDELDVHSTWFLPSDEYSMSGDIAKDLANGSAIGSHDIKHDGKLIHVRDHDKLVARLRESRLRLERIFEKGVVCFRSPLLQFSRTIVAAQEEAGYRYDFSLPCWEPVHPLTMSGFGIESAQAFEIDGVIELPLTLFQDHQLFNVLRMNVREAIKFWIKQAELLRSFDADIVLLIHPDYSFSQDLRGYRELLTSLLEVETPFLHQC